MLEFLIFRKNDIKKLHEIFQIKIIEQNIYRIKLNLSGDNGLISILRGFLANISLTILPVTGPKLQPIIA